MKRTPGADKATRSNQSSEKLLTIMECLSAQDEPVRLQEIARLVSMNESTTLRYIATLQKSGYVVQDVDTGRYSLTYKICAIAANVSSRKNIRNICSPYLRSIAHIFSESANVAEEHNMMVVYIEAISGPHQLLMTTRRVGNVSPMHCTAVGKLLLLNYTQQQLHQYVAAKGLPAMTMHTITDPAALFAELDKVRAQGYAFDNEEYEPGARCIAAPIYDYTGRVVAGLSVSGPVTRMTDEHIYEKLPFLLDAAAQVSQRMGYDESVRGGKERLMGPLTLCRLTGGSIGLSVLHTVDELLEADLGGVFWISAPRLHPDEYRVLGERLGLHPMVISDLSHAARRASHEDYGSYSHLALNLACEDTKGRLRRKNIQFLLWQERLVSFCEHGEEQFAATFELLRSGYLRPDDDLVIRSFCLAMSDILRDAAALAERIDARIDALEDELFRGVQSSQLERIHDLKSGTLEIRRTTVPMRDAFLMLLRGGGDLMSQNVYLRDVGEQIAQLCEMAENSRETVADLADLYMTLMSNSTNAVMKTLTLVSTIFIPITFIVGLYGMNFRYMPELGWRYGYPACLLLMAAVSAGMVLYFRKKKWM